ncbi:hypothetical protein JYK02_12560 [Corallococcus macrosporus]|uniref:Uncharacterized protein n=1 Tax=Corallococcus macrosporus TaxID=35 RepID=A0ABS3D9I9_9BACT|nr:hypothetical protein [Corallococcus macrosporus]MBN8228334.1 hypothetical protein [Corallococcus macrosporus]
MGWYSSRVSELNEQLNRASEGAPDTVKRALSDAIVKVGNAADQALSAMLDASERTSAGNLGTPRKWQERCATATADISRAFGDAAKDHMLSPALQLFWYQALEHEMAFFDSLAKVQTPQLHDDLLVGIFVQSLGSETLEQLAESYLFCQHLEEITRKDAAGKLKALPGNLQSEADSALERGLRPLDDLVNRVPEEVRELARVKNQRFKEHVRARLKDRIQALLPAIVELADLWDPNNLSRDFSREELEKALR